MKKREEARRPSRFLFFGVRMPNAAQCNTDHANPAVLCARSASCRRCCWHSRWPQPLRPIRRLPLRRRKGASTPIPTAGDRLQGRSIMLRRHLGAAPPAVAPARRDAPGRPRYRAGRHAASPANFPRVDNASSARATTTAVHPRRGTARREKKLADLKRNSTTASPNARATKATTPNTRSAWRDARRHRRAEKNVEALARIANIR
jgi:hypothetical protein